MSSAPEFNTGNIETITAFSLANNLGCSNENPSGDGDMEVHKAMLFYYVVTSKVTYITVGLVIVV